MSNQSSPPPLPPFKPKNRQTIKIIIGVCAAAFLIANLIKIVNRSSADLEVTKRETMGMLHKGSALEVTNKGEKPVTILSITINERSDCKPSVTPGAAENPIELLVGDSHTFYSQCNTVRLSIETDFGTYSYSF